MTGFATDDLRRKVSLGKAYDRTASDVAQAVLIVAMKADLSTVHGPAQPEDLSALSTGLGRPSS